MVIRSTPELRKHSTRAPANEAVMFVRMALRLLARDSPLRLINNNNNNNNNNNSKRIFKQD